MAIISSLGAKARNMAAELSISAPNALEFALDELMESEPQLISHESELAKQAGDEIFGFGFLQPFLDDSTIEEVWVNQPGQVQFARSGVSASQSVNFTEDQLKAVIERMLRPTGRRLDRSSPFVDASLPDGSRLHVVIPDITRKYWSLNIRKFPSQIISLADLVVRGSLSAGWAQYLAACVSSGKNILVSGATQAGKTTMLCALLAELPKRERIISVEETFEIRVQNADWVAMQTRQPNLEGIGEVGLRRLIKESLRMRPSRLVVGEVREAESLDLLIALNSGLPGLCTIHANSAREAITKLTTLPLLAGKNITREFVVPTVAACIQVVVHCQLAADGSRKVQEICEIRWNAESEQIEIFALATDSENGALDALA